MQTYSNPSRASDPYALPDIEVFYVSIYDDENGVLNGPGWYWQPCFPGCLPDSEPIGPFKTAASAEKDAQSCANA